MENTRYTLIKIPVRTLINSNNTISMTMEEAREKGCLIAQDSSLLIDQMERLRGYFSAHITELILVVAKKSPKLEASIRSILEQGFVFNGMHYSRFGKSASQSKAGITAFVADSIYHELYQATQLGIPVDECVISKYEAQRCLPFSSCTIIRDFFPRICMIGEYQKVLKDQFIKYVTESEKEFTDPESGQIKKFRSRDITEGYKDVKLSPFDGCGCHEHEFVQAVTAAFGLDYECAGSQVRLPFIKGYSVYMPFRKILHEWGYERITDIYGHQHNIDEIDCIWNVSMFKGHKLFLDRFGDRAWETYLEKIHHYRFPLGISKYSHHMKHMNLKTRMNFQYLQCLDLWNPKYVEWFEDKARSPYQIMDPVNKGKIISIAEYTTGLYEKIIKGDPFYTYKFMGITDTEDFEPESKYMEAVLINDMMFKDPAVKQFIYRKLKKSILEAKLGKIYVEGFYHTLTGDMIGYLQYAAGLEPTGCLKAGEFYADTLPPGKVLSFRSPLVCPSEVNEVSLVSGSVALPCLSHLKGQDIVMTNMYDLSLPQQGGADEDGDAVLLCSNPIIIQSKINKPIIIDIEDKLTAQVKAYTPESITDYEMSSRDSRIGEITNAATSIENKHTTNPDIRRLYSDYASLLRVIQGKEIDSIKTGVRWHMNSGLKKHLKKLPWFLLYHYPQKLKLYEQLREKNRSIAEKENQLELNGFKSPSPMNELCDYICTWEKKHLLWDHSTADTRSLILNHELSLNDKKIIRAIRHLINDYSVSLKQLFIDLEASKDEDSAKYRKTELLIQDYQEKIRKAVGINDEELTANYVILVSYSNLSISKGLAWAGYGDYIIKNLRKNSPKKQPVRILEVPAQTDSAYEYLGKYYLLKENEGSEIRHGLRNQ